MVALLYHTLLGLDTTYLRELNCAWHRSCPCTHGKTASAGQSSRGNEGYRGVLSLGYSLLILRLVV